MRCNGKIKKRETQKVQEESAAPGFLASSKRLESRQCITELEKRVKRKLDGKSGEAA